MQNFTARVKGPDTPCTLPSTGASRMTKEPDCMSNAREVVLIPNKKSTRRRQKISSAHTPDVRIIALVECLARQAAERDFQAEPSDPGRKREDGRET